MKATIGGKEVALKLIEKPDRLLELDGLSLRYPSNNTFQFHGETQGGPQWTLKGARNALIITQADIAVDLDKFRQASAEGLTTRFGAANVTSAAGGISLGEPSTLRPT